jgi:hypothetical protein
MHSQTHHHFHSSNKSRTFYTDKFFVKQMTMENDRKTSKQINFFTVQTQKRSRNFKKKRKKTKQKTPRLAHIDEKTTQL